LGSFEGVQPDYGLSSAIPSSIPLEETRTGLGASFSDTSSSSGTSFPGTSSPGASREWELPAASDKMLAENRSSAAAPNAWRSEVAARVHSYKARRPARPPRYPSLQLKFESAQENWNEADRLDHLAGAPEAAPEASAESSEFASIPGEEGFLQVADSPPDLGARILEFPRSFLPPVPLEELADPGFERPWILEVPELEPPRPALGGILIEPEEESEEKRPGFDVPLQAAPMALRLRAVVLDGFIVLSASALFAYVFFRLSATIPPARQAVGLALALTALFWAAYQYLLLVLAGTTPGLRAARLELHRFDGTPVPKRIRRWRVFASVLSGLSLGLGYAWCWLDEDQLCWHDRITRTYMAPLP
jgi:uncharacterized RDD family membrane protein YckC